MAYREQQSLTEQAVTAFNKALPPEQYLAKLEASYGTIYKKLSLRPNIKYDNNNGNYQVSLYMYTEETNLCHVSNFYINPFPGCCTMMQLHSFSVNEGIITQEQFNIYLETVLKLILPTTMHFATGRLMVAMVQSMHGVSVVTPEGKKLTQDNRIDYAVTGTQPVPLAEKPIQYSYFYNYFQLQKKVNTTLMYNQNTGNIVHLLEVIFDRSKF